MRLFLFYTVVQKSQKWPKTQIKGGPALKRTLQHSANSWPASAFGCTTCRVEPGIRVTLTLRGSKIAWGGSIDLKTTPIVSFWAKGLRKNTEVWLLPSIVVKSDTPPPPSIETLTRNKGHRSKIAVMSTQYRTHAKWWGIAGDARRERALSPHVFRHFLHFSSLRS